jgi:glycosyltransferase involved in cell wall biosynthesis
VIPITGIVVVYNEAKRLNSCLDSLSFCSQLIVIDLGSTDGSIEISKKFTAEIYSWPREQVVERIFVKKIKLANNDWIISQDPDEIFPYKLAEQINSVILANTNIGIIKTPIQYYFLNQILNSTVWGGTKTKDRVFHKKRTFIAPEVHQMFQTISGYDVVEIPFEDGNAIQHFWVDSIFSMVTKHWRYIKLEGKSRFISGERFTIKKLLGATFYSLYNNLFNLSGINDGARGIFLSFFNSWYESMSCLSLLWYQMSGIDYNG